MEDKRAETYEAAGVRYADMDPFKIQAQRAAVETSELLDRHGIKELAWSRGESAYLFQLPDGTVIAHVEEGLGTKNLIADQVRKDLGRSFYDRLAQDTVAMIVNDLVTLGAQPVSVAMHVAAGSSDWFLDEERAHDLVEGWRYACELSGAAWSGGETPTLKGVVVPGTVVLSGSAIGIAQPRDLIRGYVEPGDAIVMVGSTGIHANGLTLARKIVERHPQGYNALLADGRPVGEALLEATAIYARLVAEVQSRKVRIPYAVHITGHGWRKLMRLPKPLAYIIEQVPEPQPVFRFLAEHGPIDTTEAYATFNMGAGFAFYVRPGDAHFVLEAARECGFRAWIAGHVEAAESPRVEIKPLGITYRAESLAIR